MRHYATLTAIARNSRQFSGDSFAQHYRGMRHVSAATVVNRLIVN